MNQTLTNLVEEYEEGLCDIFPDSAAVDDDTSVPSGSPLIDTRSLDHSLVQGIAWTGSMKWVSQILTWVGSLFVARLLTPQDYGLVGMAAVYMGFVSLLNEFGLGTVIVTQRDLTNEQVKQLNTFSIFLGLTFFAVSCLASLPLAVFFKTSQLRWVLAAMSTAFVITAFRTVPYAILQRDLQFKTLALIEAIQSLIQAFSMVVFALVGLRYWTLVLGGLVGTVASTVLVWTRSRQPFAWPQAHSLKRALNFSADVLIARISWYFSSNADFLVAGRVLGKAALGAYTFGWTIANIPLERISTLITRLTPSVFSAVQSELASLRRYLLTLTEGLALITFPISFGVAIVAEELVLVVLGEKWRGVVLPLRLLSAYAGFRSIFILIPQLLVNTGHVKFWKWNCVATTILLPISFYVGSHWGTGGIAAAWIVIHPFVVLPYYWKAFRTIKLSPLEYFKSVLPALWGSLCMGCVVLALKILVAPAWALPFRLGVEILGGVATYLSVLLIYHRPRLTAFHEYLVDLRST